MNRKVLSHIFTVLEEKGGKYVDFCCNDYGYLIGATSTNEDYYYLYIKSNLKIAFSSAVGSVGESYNVVPNNDFSILDYMLKNDVDGLINRIKKEFKKYNDVLITPLYINNKRIELNKY